jgi:hypothetical protein
MADEAAEHHRSVCQTVRVNDKHFKQRSPIDQELRSDEKLSEVWNLCFGWHTRAGVAEQIERSLEFHMGLDCIIPNSRNQGTVNQ